MASKQRKPRSSDQVEVYKSIRKEPVPPGRVIQPKNRELDDEVAEREMEQWRGWRGEYFEDFEDD